MNDVNLNIEYYNNISNEYDQTVLNTKDHKFIRKQVAEVFKSEVKIGNVLDFGGGTGLDLLWLCEAGYKVFFYEPSLGMKENAIKLVNEHKLIQNVTFINSIQTSLKVNSIIANFAVMNSIKNINNTFEEFSKIIDDNGTIFLLVINAHSKKFLFSKNYLIRRLKSILSKEPVTFNIIKDDYTHCVYMHRINDYKKASDKWFSLNKTLVLGGYGFLLLQFGKKQIVNHNKEK